MSRNKKNEQDDYEVITSTLGLVLSTSDYNQATRTFDTLTSIHGDVRLERNGRTIRRNRRTIIAKE